MFGNYMMPKIYCRNQRDIRPERGERPYDHSLTSRARNSEGEWVKVCSWCGSGMPFAKQDLSIVVKKIIEEST